MNSYCYLCENIISFMDTEQTELSLSNSTRIDEIIPAKKLSWSFWTAFWIILSIDIFTALFSAILDKIGMESSNTVLQTLRMLTTDIVSYSIPILILLWLIKNKHKYSFGISFKGDISFRFMVVSSLVLLGYFYLYYSTIGLTLEKIPMGEMWDSILASMEIEEKKYPVYSVLITCLFGPIAEEFIFRGFVLKGLLGRYKPSTAILFSALLFGITHGNIPQFVNGTLIGLVLGFIYYQTHSLLACILLHCLVNANTYLFDYLSLPVGVSVSVGLFLLLLGLILWSRSYPAHFKHVRFMNYFVRKETNRDMPDLHD